MIRRRYGLWGSLVLAALCCGAPGGGGAFVGATRVDAAEYLGAIILAPDACDPSGLEQTLEDGTPANRLGPGSAIAYTGHGHRYRLLPDRGPNAGKWNPAVNNTTSYPVRWITMDITIDRQEGGPWEIQYQQVGATMMTDEHGRPFIGLSTAYDATNSPASQRRDPESLRVDADGVTYVGDEYGPFIDVFDAAGRRLRSLPPPEKFRCLHPMPSKAEEIAANATGRTPNHGFEGLALTPDGRTLVAMVQGPLLQEGTSGAVRMWVVDLQNGGARELAYLLDDADNAVNEIEAINDRQFLVEERDGKGGVKARTKKLMLIDITDASDISDVASLTAPGAMASVKPVRKELFADLLAGVMAGRPIVGFDRFKAMLSDKQDFDRFPEKVEGVCFGANLNDGRRTLFITTDNDFRADQPSYIFVFALDASELPGLQR